jgi:hypothetical protein
LRRLEVKVYNHQFQNRGVLARIRRKLERAVTQGECVLLDGEGVEGLSPQDLYALVAGLPENKIRAIGFPALRPFPLPSALH